MARLLIVTTVPITLRSFLLPFASHFRSKGWQVDAMAMDITSCPESKEAFDHVFDVKWSRNPLNPSNLLHAPQTIRKAVEERQYDLVHVHTPVAAFVSRYALSQFQKQGRLKMIYSAHGFHFYEGGSRLKNAAFLNLEKLAGRWTDYLVVMNQEDRKAAIGNHIVPSDRLVYMPGIGVDSHKFAPAAVSSHDVLAARAELKLELEQPLFLMIAEFNPGKRHGDALTAFSQLNNSTAHLAFAGHGPLMDEMRSLAQKLGVAGRVHFLGFRRDIPVLIRSSVATLLPSEREGLPRSVMESMSLAVPAIGADIRGIRDLLEDGSGLLVKVGDINGIAKAMEWVLANPMDAYLIGERGRKKVKEELDIEAIMKAHEDLYEKALGVEHALSLS